MQSYFLQPFDERQHDDGKHDDAQYYEKVSHSPIMAAPF